MINTDITIYHKTFDDINKVEVWQRYYYPNAWWYGGVNANANNGYTTNKNVNVRIWYKQNEDLEISKFSIGDIVVKGKNESNIETQQDITTEYCNIVGINDNKIGQSPHIHLKGQ